MVKKKKVKKVSKEDDFLDLDFGQEESEETEEMDVEAVRRYIG
jgi:hypothetical protein